MRRAAVLSTMATMLFVTGAGVLRAQRITGPPDLVRSPGSPFAKLEPVLERLHQTRGLAHDAGFQRDTALLRTRQDLVLIDAVASGGAGALRSELESLGANDLKTFGSTVSGWIPISALAGLAALGSLQFARPALMQVNAGMVTSQGDASMQADTMRAEFGVDGTGTTVGTLSDSYDDLGGAATDVANGDLPGGIVVLDDTSPGTDTDEGRAMMQLIHDVAPGAAQAFHTAFGGQADFALGIQELAGCPSGSEPGCTPGGVAASVIVDDVNYFAEPMFQDGIIAQAVDVVKNNGVAYFSSAGNSGRQSFETASGFVPSPAFTGLSGGPLHDFDPGAPDDPFQSFTLPVGVGVTFTFQWDEPFFSVSGAPGASNDLDFIITGSGDGMLMALAASMAMNVGGDPVEVLSIFNPGTIDIDGVPGADTMFNIAIEKVSGPAPGRMKYIYFNAAMSVNEYFTAGSTIYGHANAVGAEAVGAAAYFETPEFGQTPPLLEPFSSAGSTPILFDTSGAPIFEMRSKPGSVAPDGTDTTFFGSSDFDSTGFPNFFGTSAAAPHAAGLAALIRELDPLLTPDLVRGALEYYTIDMGPVGFDYDSGFGLIQGLGACVADSFETDDSSGSASPIMSGVTQEHSICSVGDDDWVSFTLTQSSRLGLGTSGPLGDTVMSLRDAGLSEIEMNDNGGPGGFSYIDRTCAADPLSAATYFVQVMESGDDQQINDYELDLALAPCCAADLVLENQTVLGTDTIDATSTATLGSNLIIDGDNIAINAPVVSIMPGVDINGMFSIGNTPACP